MRALQSRGQAEQDASDDRDHEREQQNARVDSDFLRARQAVRRGGQDETGPPAGEQQADHGGAQRQQDAFRQ